MEREIVKNDRWWNQIVTASGLVSKGGDNKRFIDLVHELEDAQFELVELKVDRKRGNDSFLHAAVEVLGYFVLYVFSRLHREQLGYTTPEHRLLEAKRISVVVLAEEPYYQSYDFAWFAENTKRGIEGLRAKGDFDCQLDFRFEKFPTDFVWKPRVTKPEELTRALANRCCMWA